MSSPPLMLPELIRPPGQQDAEEETVTHTSVSGDQSSIISDEELMKLFRDSYIPYAKRVEDRKYINLKRSKLPRSERSLGAYTAERWDEVDSLFQEFRRQIKADEGKSNVSDGMNEVSDGRRGVAKESVSRDGRSLLTQTVARPVPLAKSIGLETSTLHWYEWCVQHGYSGPSDLEGKPTKPTLGGWLNEVVDDYFKSKGLRLAVIVKEEGEEEEGEI